MTSYNGKIERYHRTLDKDTIHALTPDGVRRIIAERIDHYCNTRLHSAIGYVTPRDKLLGLDTEIWAERDRKLEAARDVAIRTAESTRYPAVDLVGGYVVRKSGGSDRFSDASTDSKSAARLKGFVRKSTAPNFIAQTASSTRP